MATIDKIRLNGTEYDIVDSGAIHSLDGYAKTADVTTAITAATSALAESLDEKLDGYVTNDDMTGYTYSKADVDKKIQDSGTFVASDYYTTGQTDAKLAEKVDTTAFTEYKGEVAAELADKLEAADIANYFDGASYNDGTKNIEFTHDGTVKATVSALPFIKDGMVDNVEVKDGKLVITFNTDAGKEDIELEITDIFNADNYYSKDAADKQFGTLAEQTQLRSDVEDIMGEVASLEADKQDKLTGVYVSGATTDGEAIKIKGKSFEDGGYFEDALGYSLKINGKYAVSGNKGESLDLATKAELAGKLSSDQLFSMVEDVRKVKEVGASFDEKNIMVTYDNLLGVKTEPPVAIPFKTINGEGLVGEGDITIAQVDAYTKAESDAKYAVKATVEGTTLVLG